MKFLPSESERKCPDNYSPNAVQNHSRCGAQFFGNADASKIKERDAEHNA